MKKQLQSRIKLIEERISLYEQYEKRKKLTIAQQTSYLTDLKELVKLKRISEGLTDLLFFMYQYFSEDRNPENQNNLIPAGVTTEDTPEFHRELCKYLHIASNVEPTKRICWSVPRGHAKSAYLSNMFPLHQVVYGLRKYILIISETESIGISQEHQHKRASRKEFTLVQLGWNIYQNI